MPLVASGPVPLMFHSSKTLFWTSGSPRTKSSKLSVPMKKLAITMLGRVADVHTRLGTIDGERQVVVLEVQANTREIDDGLDAGFL